MILPGTGRGTIRRRANGGGGPSLCKPEVYAARKLRRRMSPPELLLWSQIRGQGLGFRGRKRHPIGPYSVDFYVPPAELVIEVDGSAHDHGHQPRRDQIRDRYLEGRGYRVLHIPALEVMKNLAGVLSLISARVTNPLHHPLDGPPPHPGEER